MSRSEVRVRPSDVVLHKPTGETWVVCGVDPTQDRLIPCGYPFPTMAKLSDCEMVKEWYSKEGQPEAYKAALRAHGLESFIEK